MKLLITGGLGYLGGRLTQYLLRDDRYEIILGSRSKKSILTQKPHVQVVQMHWESDQDLERTCEGVEVIVHLAGMNAQDCVADPVGAINCNAVATKRLLRAAVYKGVKRFVYLSTAHVYASPLVGRVSEGVDPVNSHPYATSHLIGEAAVREAANTGVIEGVVIRLSNSFGAPVRKEVNCWMLLVNDLCKQAVMTGKIVLRSEGLQQRDFITLEKACGAIKYFVGVPPKKLGDGLYNVGGSSMRVIDMAKMIQERCINVLDIYPEIHISSKHTFDQETVLDYATDKLHSLGFSFRENQALEIDKTLKACKLFFGKES